MRRTYSYLPDQGRQVLLIYTYMLLVSYIRTFRRNANQHICLPFTSLYYCIQPSWKRVVFGGQSIFSALFQFIPGSEKTTNNPFAFTLITFCTFLLVFLLLEFLNRNMFGCYIFVALIDLLINISVEIPFSPFPDIEFQLQTYMCM